MPLQSTTGMYQESKYIVDNSVGAYAYTTIQSALNAAQAAGIPALVLVKPGVYTENLTLYDGIDIRGAGGFSTTSSLEIIGTHTPPLAGTVSFQNISLTSATDIFNSAAFGSSNIILKDLVVTVTNGYTFNLPNWTGGFFANSVAQSSTNNGEVRNTAGAQVFYTNSEFGFGTVNHATISNSCTLFNVVSRCPITFQTSGNVFINGGSWILETLTFSGTVGANIANTYMNTNPDPAINTTSSSTITLSNVTIDTLAANAITGTGTVQFASVTYVESDTIAGTITKDFTTEFETGILKVADATNGPLYAINGLVSGIGSLTNGQLVIGSTGAAPVAATLTAGAGIGIANAAGSITISSTITPTFPWQDASGTSQAVIVNNGYFANNAAPTFMYLPSAAAQGAEEKFSNKNTGGFTVVPSSGQSVNFLTQTATYPQYFSTADIYAAMDIVCETTNTAWNVVNHEGSFGIITPPFLFEGMFTGHSGTDGVVHYLKVDGSVWNSGTGNFGELGNNTANSYSSPIVAVGNHAFTKLACLTPNFGCLGLKSDGSCWGWGGGANGQLGNLSTNDQSSPVSVVGNHSFVKINSGSYGLKSDGSCWAWGFGGRGELGNLSTNDQSSPVSVVGNHSFIEIIIGGGLKVDGSAWMWGANISGTLGDGTTNDQSSPVAVIGNHSFIKICGGGYSNHVLALKDDGSCWSWGSGSWGQLGNLSTNDQSSPVSVVGNHSFIEINMTANAHTSCGLKADGSVWTWGNGTNGISGDLTTTSYSSPIAVVGNHSFIHLLKLSAGDNLGAWKSDGTLWVWGDGRFGQLGNNTLTSVSSPVLVLNTP